MSINTINNEEENIIKRELVKYELYTDYQKKAEHILTYNEDCYVVCKYSSIYKRLFDFLEFSNKKEAYDYFDKLRDKLDFEEEYEFVHTRNKYSIETSDFKIMAL